MLYTIKAGKRKQIHSLSFAVAGLPHDPDPSDELEKKICFSESHFSTLRTYSTIVIDDNDLNNNVRILQAVGKVRDIYLRRDTVNGVHFIFSPRASYGTFIMVLDVIKVATGREFLTGASDIWAFYYPVKPREPGTIQGCFLCNDVVEIQPIPGARTPLDVVREGWQLIRKDGLPISIIFAVFATLILLMHKRSGLHVRVHSMP